MSAEKVDAVVERAKREVWQVAMGESGATPQFARRVEAAFDLLAGEVVRLRRFIPPDGWSQFGTHANCRSQARLEFSTELGEDGMPLWERPIVEPVHIWGEGTL